MRGTLPDRGRLSATAPGLRGEEKVGFIVSRNAVIRPNPTGPIRPALGHRADRSGWIPIRVVPFGFPTARRTVWSDPKKADTTRPGMDHLSTDVPSGHGLWVKSDSPIIAMVSPRDILFPRADWCGQHPPVASARAPNARTALGDGLQRGQVACLPVGSLVSREQFRVRRWTGSGGHQHGEGAG